MKRKEQINSFAVDKLLGLGPAFSESEIRYNNGYMRGLIEGAEWADENPDKNNVYTKKELREIGFGFTLNGDIVTTKEEEEMIKKYIEYKQKQLIEKAWDWIEDNLLTSNQQDKSRLYFEQFKNYIKGE